VLVSFRPKVRQICIRQHTSDYVSIRQHTSALEGHMLVTFPPQSPADLVYIYIYI
jgi:hypothetical protein